MAVCSSQHIAGGMYHYSGATHRVNNILMHNNATVSNIINGKYGSSWCTDNHIMHINYIAIDGCR